MYTRHSNVMALSRLTVKWVFVLFGVGALLRNVGNKGLGIDIENFLLFVS